MSISLLTFVQLIASASAATAAVPASGLRAVREEEACTIYQGADVVPGLPSMHARCHWPEIEVAAIDRLLAPPDGHDGLFWAVAEDTLVSMDGGRALVHHRHEALGMRAREVQVWVSRIPLSDGGFRYAWETSDRPFELTGGHILAPRNDGYWQVGPHPDGGVELVFDVAYDPGGCVPRWAVAWMQTAGTARMLREFRGHARASQARMAAGQRDGNCRSVATGATDSHC